MLEQQTDSQCGDSGMKTKKRLKKRFKSTQISFLVNFIALIIFLGIQIFFVVQFPSPLGIIVLIFTIMTLFAEALSYNYQRYMKVKALINAEWIIISIETTIVVISIYQISKGEIIKDGNILSWIQLGTLLIFVLVTILKLILVILMSQDFYDFQELISRSSHLENYLRSEEHSRN